MHITQRIVPPHYIHEPVWWADSLDHKVGIGPLEPRRRHRRRKATVSRKSGL
jgi:hypothetical protein